MVEGVRQCGRGGNAFLAAVFWRIPIDPPLSDCYNLSKSPHQGVKMEKKDFQAKPEPVFYTVQEGDTLSAIAVKFYDDAAKYMVIYEANKDLIGDDPSLIKMGQELKIPPQK
jgi:nucleoid-associated protein YgaU